MYTRLEKFKVKVYFTDRWKSYSEIIDCDRLYQTKKETNGIERNNGRQRHWFARFRRRTCVVSQSLKNLDLTMFLFANYHVNQPLYKLVNMYNC